MSEATVSTPTCETYLALIQPKTEKQRLVCVELAAAEGYDPRTQALVPFDLNQAIASKTQISVSYVRAIGKLLHQRLQDPVEEAATEETDAAAPVEAENAETEADDTQMTELEAMGLTVMNPWPDDSRLESYDVHTQLVKADAHVQSDPRQHELEEKLTWAEKKRAERLSQESSVFLAMKLVLIDRARKQGWAAHNAEEAAFNAFKKSHSTCLSKSRQQEDQIDHLQRANQELRAQASRDQEALKNKDAAIEALKQTHEAQQAETRKATGLATQRLEERIRELERALANSGETSAHDLMAMSPAETEATLRLVHEGATGDKFNWREQPLASRSRVITNASIVLYDTYEATRRSEKPAARPTLREAA